MSIRIHMFYYLFWIQQSMYFIQECQVNVIMLQTVFLKSQCALTMKSMWELTAIKVNLFVYSVS